MPSFSEHTTILLLGACLFQQFLFQQVIILILFKACLEFIMVDKVLLKMVHVYEPHSTV